ncbi:hypothetical protein HDV00_007613 [Rhizophlyctis rosea]|nr:hypothetical protein HDV00_007613 [Rhizophlyctis rosea]
MSQPLTILITGANRGIGLGLATQFLSTLPTATIFALARDPNAESLHQLAQQYPSRVHAVECDVSSPESTQTAGQKVKDLSPTGLDIVIANAGINLPGAIATIPSDTFLQVLKVNTLGPLHTFQAFWPLLKLRETKKYFVISSGVGSSESAINRRFNGAAAYGTSKAAVNYFVRCVEAEHGEEGVVSMALCPGWVQTDMGNAYAKNGAKATFTLEESVVPLVKVMLEAEKKDSGRYCDRFNKDVPY